MAATTGHRLTLDPMGKYSNAFFSETTNMIKAKLYMNVHWMVLYNLKVFCSDMKFKKAATAGLSLTLDPIGKNVSKCFFSETTWTVETKLPRNDHWKVLYKFYVFYADRKSKMAATAGHTLTLDPMGKCSNAFFSETTDMIKAKMYMNFHWMVLYNLKVFCSDMKFKMAATAGLSLTLDPIGKNVSKCFFSETTWTVETKLPRNDHWKVLYKFSVFYADRKSKMAATAGHRLTLDPMGKYSNAFFSETTNMIKAKLYMNVH